MSNPAAEARTEPQHKRATMTYKTVKYSVFADAATKLGVAAPGDLSEALGYSRSCFNIWRKSGRMPKPAALACECLLRRQNKEADAPASQDIFVMLVPQDRAKMLLRLCDVMDAKLITRVPTA